MHLPGATVLFLESALVQPLNAFHVLIVLCGLLGVLLGLRRVRTLVRDTMPVLLGDSCHFGDFVNLLHFLSPPSAY